MTEAPLVDQFKNREALKRRYLWVLATLLFLFCLRVLGQFLVAFLHVSFLPPMEEWMSGLVPYPELLTAQILIIALYGKVCLDFFREHGFFAVPRRLLGTGLLIFGSLYFGVMVIRYTIRMSLYPHERWVGGCIPIFFHWVLSSFILVLGTYHWRTTQRPPRPGIGKRLLQGAAAVAALLCISAWATYQTGPSLLAYRLGLRRSQFAVREQKGAALLTSDGISLVADIYHPQHAARTPTILVRIPLTRDFKNSLFASMIDKMWAERGYTVVIQGTRGRFGSGGTFYPLRGERQDGIETLQWIAKQSWFDGHVLTWGGSAFGQTQWVIADQSAPGPSALMVYFASTDFHDMFYPGGAFSLDSALSWAVRSHGVRDQPDWPSADAVERAATGFPLLDADRRATGANIDFFKDWVEHPDRDAFWADIDDQNRVQSLKAPVLLMAGWYDPFLPTQLNDFIHIRQSSEPIVATRSRLIIGPWTHASEITFPDGTKGANFRLQSLAASLPWFDENSGKTMPSSASSPVRIFVMGKNEWRNEQEWPLARTRYTPYFLGSTRSANSVTGDGTLNTLAPTAEEPADSYAYDPLHPVPTAGGAMIGPAAGIARQNDIEGRSDVLVYTTPSLNEDLEVTGPISLVLYVSTTAPSTDFTAKLLDVHQDGSAFNISEGILRRSYQEAQDQSAAQKVYEIHLDLWPTSMVFFKGHRIRLEVSSSNFPRFDRNPNNGNRIAAEMNTISAKQTVSHDPKYPSRLIMPIIPIR
ncbi:CocE/NonD family hydrolase [Terracidiphilus gabretensis]|uniref:CocE/NonD family hydrolase n=1 Tax=Terracidiphilus gabretensis TaxID=1577687 RepID=UPI00071B5A8B|nr:CocE/NonD family hydrolase [Terracidiphilus gabretensis]